MKSSTIIFISFLLPSTCLFSLDLPVKYKSEQDLRVNKKRSPRVLKKFGSQNDVTDDGSKVAALGDKKISDSLEEILSKLQEEKDDTLKDFTRTSLNDIFEFQVELSPHTNPSYSTCVKLFGVEFQLPEKRAAVKITVDPETLEEKEVSILLASAHEIHKACIAALLKNTLQTTIKSSKKNDESISQIKHLLDFHEPIVGERMIEALEKSDTSSTPLYRNFIFPAYAILNEAGLVKERNK